MTNRTSSKQGCDQIGSGNTATVSRLHFKGNDAELVATLRTGQMVAATALFERHATHVRRVLIRILGDDQELPDLISEVFYQALKSANSINEGAKLKSWLTCLTVNTARSCIRKRQRNRWLSFQPFIEPKVGHSHLCLDEETQELVNEIHKVLIRMSVDDRVIFILRFVQEMETQELADALGVSLATAKRRLARTERRFKANARKQPALLEQLERNPKWRRR